ncbi:sulfotransferase domain-containing protein [Actinocorallia longicatena]|uniref:Sulfotransferase domain-containing protein n=1 Tax=Actinocorallia longicatena TaxID=111803 RepID=A0ABP6Q813_9ACTN
MERAHSNWTHLWSAGLEPAGDVVSACAEEESRIDAGWSAFWHYVGLGRYGEQLEHLYTLFPREQVLVFRYKDLLDEPEKTLDRIVAFLGAETGLVTSVPRENVTAHPEPTLRHRLLGRALRVVTAVDSALPGHPLHARATVPLERALQRNARARRPLTWEERSALLPFFESDVKLLETVTGEDFSDWLMPRESSGGRVGGRPTGQHQARNGRAR